MTTEFINLNSDWNAEPNSPREKMAIQGSDIILSFFMNPHQFPQFNQGQSGRLRFTNCWRYRLGGTNDHGWYLGHCRFSRIAPSWGEFYEVRGDLRLDEDPEGWILVGATRSTSRHFLFYLRDDTFECDADDGLLTVGP